MSTKPRGFTLIEMLVAVGIFAVLGILSAQILSHSVRITDTIIDRSERLKQVQLALNVMSRDFSQYVYRPIRDELGDPIPGLILDSGNLLEFTRAGWINPKREWRSTMQRVSYMITDDAIYRRYWQVLDRAPDSVAIEQLLLKNVVEAEITVIDQSGDEHYFWPPTPVDRDGASPTPLALKISLVTDPVGNIGRHWILPFSSEFRLLQEENPEVEGT